MGSTPSTTHPGISHDVRLLQRSDDKTCNAKGNKKSPNWCCFNYPSPLFVPTKINGTPRSTVDDTHIIIDYLLRGVNPSLLPPPIPNDVVPFSSLSYTQRTKLGMFGAKLCNILQLVSLLNCSNQLLKKIFLQSFYWFRKRRYSINILLENFCGNGRLEGILTPF